jgi:hypothetical protein
MGFCTDFTINNWGVITLEISNDFSITTRAKTGDGK